MERHIRHGFWTLFAGVWAIYKVACIFLGYPGPGLGWKLWNATVALIMTVFFVVLVREWRASK